MPNVFESRASGNQELIYPENKSSLDRSTAIANTTASKMSENDWNSQSRARSGHDLRPLQRLVHNGCLVYSIYGSHLVAGLGLAVLGSTCPSCRVGVTHFLAAHLMHYKSRYFQIFIKDAFISLGCVLDVTQTHSYLINSETKDVDVLTSIPFANLLSYSRKRL